MLYLEDKMIYKQYLFRMKNFLRINLIQNLSERYLALKTLLHYKMISLTLQKAFLY
jgi:hypothetical protein